MFFFPGYTFPSSPNQFLLESGYVIKNFCTILNRFSYTKFILKKASLHNFFFFQNPLYIPYIDYFAKDLFYCTEYIFRGWCRIGAFLTCFLYWAVWLELKTETGWLRNSLRSTDPITPNVAGSNLACGG